MKSKSKIAHLSGSHLPHCAGVSSLSDENALDGIDLDVL